jgi:hypothetical protein
MGLLDLTYFLMEINAALDTGHYEDVTIKEIVYHLDQGDIVEFLGQRLVGDVNLSYFEEDNEKSFELNNQLYKVFLANENQEYENFGVQNNGLCLLIAYITEIMQNVAKDVKDPTQ